MAHASQLTALRSTVFSSAEQNTRSTYAIAGAETCIDMPSSLERDLIFKGDPGREQGEARTSAAACSLTAT